MIAHPPHDLVRAVRAELAVPGRYHLEPPHAVRQSWIALAFRWLIDRYREFIHALSARVHVGPQSISLIGDVIVVLTVLAIGVVAARLLIAVQLERSRAASTGALEPARSAYAFYRAAKEEAAQGRYARAIRLLFTATVTLLDLRGVVADDESATINELRRELSASRIEAEAPFTEIARAYTATVYAQEVPDARAWEAARNAYDRLSGAIASS